MNNKLKPYFLIAPVSILLGSIMLIGLTNCIAQSLGYFPQIGMNNITLNYYKEILGEVTFLKSLLFSMKTSLISALVSVFIGVILAYLLCQNKYSKLRLSILQLPVVIPHIIVVILTIFIFSQTGIISRIFFNLGIIQDSSDFVNLILDKKGIGIILVYLWKGIPYVALTTYNILRNISGKLEMVALNLGASK